jgi:hypothetical protein
MVADKSMDVRLGVAWGFARRLKPNDNIYLRERERERERERVSVYRYTYISNFFLFFFIGLQLF